MPIIGFPIVSLAVNGSHWPKANETLKGTAIETFHGPKVHGWGLLMKVNSAIKGTALGIKSDPL